MGLFDFVRDAGKMIGLGGMNRIRKPPTRPLLMDLSNRCTRTA